MVDHRAAIAAGDVPAPAMDQQRFTERQRPVLIDPDETGLEEDRPVVDRQGVENAKVQPALEGERPALEVQVLADRRLAMSRRSEQQSAQNHQGAEPRMHQRATIHGVFPGREMAVHFGRIAGPPTRAGQPEAPHVNLVKPPPFRDETLHPWSGAVQKRVNKNLTDFR